ncbi:hypothetical protein [Parasphingopyxis lamellibrachiae]|uniref:hypothetical protein n=1 Tax=Parasphingopyxis lamellibrachiae TaxID=680125 RepID=UPI0011C04208|nr:hypothetical protein [Parasphingopyxis lamellibrachiae]
MKYLSAAIALAIAVPAAAYDNHQMQGHEMRGEDAQPMMCCHGSAEEREACRERHRAMGHDMGDCDAERMHGDGAHDGHGESGEDDRSAHSDNPADDQ